VVPRIQLHRKKDMIYTNGDGIWFRCSCQRDGAKLLASNHHPVVTMQEMKELVEAHGHH